MKFIKEEELGKKYYNLKNKNFGNTRGHKKSYMWNKGMTPEEMKEYSLMRKNKLFCLLTEKPKKGKIYIPITKYECKFCNAIIMAKSLRVYCSRICLSNHKKELNNIKKLNKKKRVAWNKGISNPLAAENGKKGAAKQSAKVTGRKRAYREDGSWYWIYSN